MPHYYYVVFDPSCFSVVKQLIVIKLSKKETIVLVRFISKKLH